MKIVIEGEPQAKQRPRFKRVGAHVQTYTPTETLAYEMKLKKAWQKEKYEMFNDIPLSVHIMAYFPIPESYTKLKKAQAKENIIKPTTRKDVDNIAKIVLDGLNGVAYADDKFVTDLVVRKRYSENPRVEIEIKEVKE